MSAIFPVSKLINRSDKRRFVKDAKKVALTLEIINQSFIWEIFNSPNGTYKEIYIEHLDKWQKATKRILTDGKIYNAAIDVLFFSREYQPQHNDKS